MNNIVSIIVPIYNVEKYLDKCIQSIVNQTYKYIEIILINDGSTDGCLDICRKWSFLDDRIKIINKKNGGLSDARNTGIVNSSGEYLFFVDSDDWIECNIIERLITLCNKYNSEIAICEYISAYDEDRRINDSNRILDEVKLFNKKDILYNLYNDLYVTTIVSWNKLYKRELFNNINFPVGKIHEDEFTIYKLLYKANKIAYIKDKLYYYRQRQQSIMNTGYSWRNINRVEAYYEQMLFMKGIDKNLYMNSIERYSNEIMWSYIKYNKTQNCDKEKLSEIIDRGKDVYEIVMSSSVSLKVKIKLYIFLHNINLYKNLYRVFK